MSQNFSMAVEIDEGLRVCEDFAYPSALFTNSSIDSESPPGGTLGDSRTQIAPWLQRVGLG